MAEALAPPPAPLLELRGIVKEFPGVRALDGVSLDLRPGEIHALCGENGAGKSTLIKVLCGFHPAGSYRGEMLLHGGPARFRSIRDAEERGIALIAQELALVPEMSIEANLMLGREPTRFGLLRREASLTAAREALARVGLDADPRQPVKELGVGRQQLVEVAKALSKRASVLVLDEPTAALTAADAMRLLALLEELRRGGVACLYVSHRLDEMFRIADRITVLRDGRSVGGGPAGALSHAQVITWMVGREVSEQHRRPPRRAGEPVLEVSDWSVADPLNPEREVVANVGFRLCAGEVLGLAGLVGAGRTALVSSLFGVARSRVRGCLRVAGAGPQPPFRSPTAAMNAGLVLLSEDRKRYGIVAPASVEDNLTLATLRDFVHHGTGLGLLDASARTRACRGQVDALRIRTPGLATPVERLSGGNQQKVLLGRWLMARPRILLLDEPTRGIDVGSRAEIYEWIAGLTARGLGVVVVSSDLPELLGLSHRVLVLRRGRVVAEFAGEEAAPEAVMAAAAGGTPT